MCVGTIVQLAGVHEQDGVRLGELEDGTVVPLSFVPDAQAGVHLLLHLGVPVEVLDPEAARDALCLRAEAEAEAEAEVLGGPGGRPRAPVETAATRGDIRS